MSGVYSDVKRDRRTSDIVYGAMDGDPAGVLAVVFLNFVAGQLHGEGLGRANVSMSVCISA